MVTAVFLFGYKWVESWIKVYLNIVKRFDKNKAIESTGKTHFTGEDYLAQIQKNEEMYDLNIELRKEVSDLKTTLAHEKDYVTKYISRIEDLQSLLNEKSNYNSRENLVGKWTFYVRQNESKEDVKQIIEVEALQDNKPNELVFLKLGNKSKSQWFKSLIFRQIDKEILLAVQEEEKFYFICLTIDKVDSQTGEILTLKGQRKVDQNFSDIRMERVEW